MGTEGGVVPPPVDLNPTAATGSGGRRESLWRTTTPYVLLLCGSVMALIAVALLVLACTRRRCPSRRAAASALALPPLHREPPKVAVIMAGERAPSFLASAKPLSPLSPAPTSSDPGGGAGQC